jgi:hypothetical protein
LLPAGSKKIPQYPKMVHRGKLMSRNFWV